jgi:hypothetical protein
MKNIIKLFTALLVFAAILSCSRISEKVQEKVNQKIDETIDNTMKKMDSSLNKINLDSLKKQIDTIVTRTDKKKN